MGTQIYFNPSNDDLDHHWSSMLAKGWNRDLVCCIASNFPDLVLQPESEQNPFKVSYYLTAKAANTVIPQLEYVLSQNHLQTKLIYSFSSSLDIVPHNGDKGLALQYLQKKWRIEQEKTVVCGDSGNDISLFIRQEWGIIVGNAQTELRQWYQQNQTSFHYFAQSNYAQGILEGLNHFGFFK